MFSEGDLGVLPPLGVYDPLGLIETRDMRRYEIMEIKHGRAAMLGFLHVIALKAGIVLPGELSPSLGVSFSDVPTTCFGLGLAYRRSASWPRTTSTHARRSPGDPQRWRTGSPGPSAAASEASAATTRHSGRSSSTTPRAAGRTGTAATCSSRSSEPASPCRTAATRRWRSTPARSPTASS